MKSEGLLCFLRWLPVAGIRRSWRKKIIIRMLWIVKQILDRVVQFLVGDIPAYERLRKYAM